MSQNKILINGIEIYQPDEGLVYNFETTYSASTGRVQVGKANLRPLFTVEQLGYTATNIPAAKAAEILALVGKGNYFNLTYYSAYYGCWRTDEFYVGQGSADIKTLKINEEYISKLSFNMTGVNPLA